ncbi:MAG: AI-2E family transporter [Candidatus Aquicultor sp.]|nr:AI-2E family transporter [Candidatus Aquicultor sp.]
MRELPYKKLALIFAVIWMGIGFFALAFYLFGFISNIVIWVALAGMLSYMLNGPARRLHERFHQLPWALVVVAIYLILFLVIVVISAGIGVSLTIETRGLTEDYSRFINSVGDSIRSLQVLLDGFGINVDLVALEERGIALLSENGDVVFGAFLGLLDKLSSGVSQIFLILIISLYFLLEAREISESFTSAMPERYRSEMRQLGLEIGKVVGGYTKGQLILSFIVGVFAGVGSLAFGLPYALAIGVFAALFNLIPVVGSFIGGVPAVILAFIFKGWPVALAVLIYFIVVNQVESNYLRPRIVSESVDLSPLTTMIALLIGTQLAGIIGALLAVPILSIILIFIRYIVRWYRSYTQETALAEL